MIIINFSHPITPAQASQLEALACQPIEQVISLPVSFNNQQPYLPQLAQLMAQLALSADQLQSEAILVNPPSLNFIASLVLAELHGRMGYFPPIIRLRPVEGALPPQYEVAEVLNLQAVRDRSRQTRFSSDD